MDILLLVVLWVCLIVSIVLFILILKDIALEALAKRRSSRHRLGSMRDWGR